MPRAEGNLIAGKTELAKNHPSIPRHGIHSDKYLSPTEIGKARNDLIKVGWTAPQLIKNCFFYGWHGERPPFGVGSVGLPCILTG
jgi:hypothetical protein